MKTKETVKLKMHESLQKADEYFSLMESNPSKKIIHYRRVEMKHITAYLHFYRFATGQNNSHPIPLKWTRLYKKAWLLRKWQLAGDYMEAYRIHLGKEFDKLEKRIKKNRQKAKSGFLQAVKACYIDNTTHTVASEISQIFSLTRTQLQSHRSEYKSRKLLSLQHVLGAEKVSKKKLHAVRKSVKDLYYLYEIFENEDTYFEELDALGKLLGRRNDKTEICQVLHGFYKEVHNKKVKQLRHLIAKEAKTEKKELLKSSLKTLVATV